MNGIVNEVASEGADVAFTPHTTSALEVAALVVNRPEEGDARTAKALAHFYVAEGYGASRVQPEELAALASVRDRLRDLLVAEGQEAVDLVNAALTELDARPRLVRHGEQDWHLHVAPKDAQLSTWILAETAMAMADVIRSDETSRLGPCAAADCDGVVVDMSRNRSRRYCSIACGNRAAVAAYRARRTS